MLAARLNKSMFKLTKGSQKHTALLGATMVTLTASSTMASAAPAPMNAAPVPDRSQGSRDRRFLRRL